MNSITLATAIRDYPEDNIKVGESFLIGHSRPHASEICAVETPFGHAVGAIKYSQQTGTHVFGSIGGWPGSDIAIDMTDAEYAEVWARFAHVPDDAPVLGWSEPLGTLGYFRALMTKLRDEYVSERAKYHAWLMPYRAERGLV